MRTTGFNVIIKINKKELWEHRNKIGSLYIPSDLMAFTRNMQFAEIVAVGPKVSSVNPEAQKGRIAIYHHIVEDNANSKQRTGERLIHEDDDFEYRLIISSTHEIENELFAVYYDDLLFVSKGIIICNPEVKVSGLHKISDNIFDVDDDVKAKLMNEELEYLQYEKKELIAAITKVPLNEDTQWLHEDVSKRMTEINEKIRIIQEHRNRVVFSEMTVMYSNAPAYPTGTVVCVDSSKLYPLIFDGMQFILIRSSFLVYARKEGSTYIPSKEFCIIKPDDSLKSYGNIVVPDTVKYKPNFGTIIFDGGNSSEFPALLKKGMHVNFNSRKSMKIYIDGKPHFICHYFDLFYEGDQQNITKTLSGMVLVHRPKKDLRKIIHINEDKKDNIVVGIVINKPDGEDLFFQEYDRIAFNLKYGIPYDKEKGHLLVHKAHIVDDVTF